MGFLVYKHQVDKPVTVACMFYSIFLSNFASSLHYVEKNKCPQLKSLIEIVPGY